jgi:hydrogenase nickel incorporation protein HypA/HybF
LHELSVACAIVEGVVEEAERLGGVRVKAVHLRVGPLSGIDKEALCFCFDLAAEGTPVAGAELRVEEVPVVAYCPACGCDRTLAAADALRCPVCFGPTPEVKQGRELEVVALEVFGEAPTG